MLSPPDADLARRDPALAGLSLLLDPDAFMAALSHHLPESDLRTAQITYVRYKPRTSCLVGYQFDLQGQAVNVYARAHRLDAIDKIRKYLARPAVPGSLGPGPFLLEEHATLVSCFPNDAKLVALARLAKPAARQRLLYKIIPERPELGTGKLQQLRYKPERRYVARIHAEDNSGLVLKLYTGPDYQAAQLNARVLESRGPLRLARRLGRSNRHHILALEWLPGRLLEDIITLPEPEVEKVTAVGVALAELHAQNPKRLKHLTHADEAKALFAVAKGIAFVCPHLAGHANDLVRRMSALIADEPVLDYPIHGDFYAAQVLLAGDAVAILDLDQAARGDPASDLATFVAHLESDAIRGHFDPDHVAPVQEALLKGYQAATRHFISARLQLYTAARLFRLAPHPFRQREGCWPEKTEAVLERVEALLKTFTTGQNMSVPGSRSGTVLEPGVAVNDSLGAAADPQMPFLKRALDPVEVQRLLMNNLPRLAGVTGQLSLQAIRVPRYKPGRRCVVEYDSNVQYSGAGPETITVVGKVHARRLKWPVYQILESLWSAGFAAGSQDGIAIPEPLGVIPEFHMYLQRKVPGVPATWLLLSPDGGALASRIAEAVHKIHQAGIPANRRHTIADELNILRERLLIVAQDKPQWLQRLERLLNACYRVASTIAAVAPTGIHRDFYADQIIVDGSRLYLLDFDLYCEGDPALDIGNFLAHIKEFSLRTFGNADALANCEAALEERFVELAAGSREVTAIRTAVQVYTTLTLARHIYLSTQFPKRRRFTKVLLELCEQRLDVARRPYNSRVTSRETTAPRAPLRPGFRQP